jgi:hypothetical protein
MPNNPILNALRNIILDLEKKGPQIRCSSLFYLINSLFLCYELSDNFMKYNQTNEKYFLSDLFSSSNVACLFLWKALDNNDLPQNTSFIVNTLHEMTGPIQDSLMDFEEHIQALEEIKVPTDFIIKNLEEICDELFKLNYPISHENNERCFEIEAWWKEKYQSKSA